MRKGRERLGGDLTMGIHPPVEIADYDPDWPERFARTGRALREALGDLADRIDHIGSTAVPGLAAKPIIDVQVSVLDLEPGARVRNALEGLGLVFRGDNPDRTKRYFREPPGTPRTHVHVRRLGSWSEQFALLFRDYLRAHQEDARRYEGAKRELAAEYRANRHAYAEAKSGIIWEIMERADGWSQESGWTPGPSDA